MFKGLVAFTLIFTCLTFSHAQPVRTMEHLLDIGYFARKATEHIKVDGNLTENTWQSAQRATNFIQNFPNDTMMASAKTEVMVSYDDHHIYFAAIVHNSVDSQQYITPSLKRDFRGEANDAIVISIDPFMDRMNSFSFGINPFGVQREGLVVNGGVVSEDLSLSWDNKWFSAAETGDRYWSAEFAIPFTTLRFKEGQTRWNVKFYRQDSKENERAVWPLTPRFFEPGNLHHHGEMIWDKPTVRPGANVSVIPYLAGLVSRDFVKDDPVQPQVQVGGDAKPAK